jgi:dihydrofolate synthase/folylpolyglutamate synthase
MDYAQTLEYLYNRLPMFHRIGAAAYRANLDNIHLLSRELGAPELSFPSIHIAGTNGKGSVSHMLASILQRAGYKTGLYTSPHLKDFRERIRVNGKMISEEEVSEFINNHRFFFDKEGLSFFEMTVGLAFDHFRNEKVDYAVIETGLGGRLDATNIIQPILSVITNISLDHTQILGTTLSEIAFEKAGIIKKKTPVIIGESDAATESVFIEKAKEMNAGISFADQLWSSVFVKENYNSLSCDIFREGELVYEKLELDLPGHYQLKNILTVLASIEKLREAGLVISDTHLREALSRVRLLTGFAGRWQVLSENPLIICDTAHNTAGLKEVMKQLSEMPCKQLHFVLGMVSDKDVDAVLKLFPSNARYYFCKPALPRGLDAGELSVLAQKYGLRGLVYDSVGSAYDSARKQAEKEDIIYIGGSTFVVAEVV